MDNVYVLVTYLAVVIGLVGVFLLKISDIFEQKRERKYYEMLKEDAAFWQMKIEQSGMTIAEWAIEKFIEESFTDSFTESLVKKEESEEKESEDKSEKKEDLFEGLDEWLPF